jgi:hypothetical protein
MRTVLAHEPGRGLYNRRSVMIEPVFADEKHNRKIDRFQRRGRAAVRSEWRLINATHNLLKLHAESARLAGALVLGTDERPVRSQLPDVHPHAGAAVA